MKISAREEGVFVHKMSSAVHTSSQFEFLFTHLKPRDHITARKRKSRPTFKAPLTLELRDTRKLLEDLNAQFRANDISLEGKAIAKASFMTLMPLIPLVCMQTY